jgi:Fe-Mn family superoxide dismutase
MKPQGGGAPAGALAQAIDAKWSSATTPSRLPSPSPHVGNFGSGWTWLVKKADGSVDIVNTTGAGTPLTTADTPLLTVRRLGTRLLHRLPQPARRSIVETFLAKLANWDEAAKNFG